MKTTKILLAISLVVICLCSLLASQVQSDFGNISIQDIRIPAEDGSSVSALLYTPKGVDESHKAPTIITCEGYLNSREMQTCFSVEYARRGYVVLAIDMYGHGRSSTQVEDFMAMGVALQYMLKQPFVDTANIALEGHSKGGFASTMAALTPGVATQVKAVLAIGSGLQWPAWYGVTMDATTPISYGTIFGSFDEFGWLFWPSSVDGRENVSANAGQSPLMQAAWGTTEPVVAEQWYGDKAANTLRIFYQPTQTHPANHISKTATGYAMNFMNEVLEGGNKAGLADHNQTWYWKEICTALSMVAWFVFIFAFGALLIGEKKKNEAALPEAKGKMGLLFWVLLCVGTAIPALTYGPFMTMASAGNFPVSRLLPMELANQVSFWAVLNGLIALALFVGMYFLTRKKEGLKAADWGLKAKPALILRQVGLGLATALAAYLVLVLVDVVFKVDFRLWVVGFMPLTGAKFATLLTYLLCFLAYALCNSIVLNGAYRFANGSYAKTAIFSVLGNALGMFCLLAFGYGGLLITGSLPFASTDWSLMIIEAIPFLVTLSMAALVNTYFFKKTGTVYMGTVITGLFLAFAVVGNTCFQFLF